MLVLGEAQRPERCRGIVLQVKESVFAPSDMLLRDHANGVLDGQGFKRRYLWELRALWHQNRQVFLDLLAQATSGDVTLMDDWSGEPQAPRRVLAGVLLQIAKRQAEDRRRA